MIAGEAAHGATAAARGAVPAEADPGHRSRPGRHLRPVEGPSRRRSPAVPVLVGVGMVLLSLFGLAVMHALLIGGQIQLDKTQREVAAEAEEVRRLRLRVAELESPDRVLEVARDRLGMVPAAEVGYLLPDGVDVGDGTLLRVAAAEAPGPEDVPAGTVSPERPPGDDGAQDDGAEDDVRETDAGAGPDDPAADGLEGGPEEATE